MCAVACLEGVAPLTQALHGLTWCFSGCCSSDILWVVSNLKRSTPWGVSWSPDAYADSEYQAMQAESSELHLEPMETADFECQLRRILGYTAHPR